MPLILAFSRQRQADLGEIKPRLFYQANLGYTVRPWFFVVVVVFYRFFFFFFGLWVVFGNRVSLCSSGCL